MNLILRWWRRRQRRIDVEVLWPALLEAANGDRERASFGFHVHMRRDPAYRDMSTIEKVDFVEALP